jgi:hypothetical protein
MINNKYSVFTTDVFPPPANPQYAATLMMGMTAAQITETNRVHTEATRLYRTYHNVNQAFKNL